ncbi:MAG: hypothetical protein KatS3mg076_1939 [Candidatus Binatia bacterium]|nr:MAG: hypothetical protein KatS3mg076_1939 [Candidatus Binatia bacterium]
MGGKRREPFAFEHRRSQHGRPRPEGRAPSRPGGGGARAGRTLATTAGSVPEHGHDRAWPSDSPTRNGGPVRAFSVTSATNGPARARTRSTRRDVPRRVRGWGGKRREPFAFEHRRSQHGRPRPKGRAPSRPGGAGHVPVERWQRPPVPFPNTATTERGPPIPGAGKRRPSRAGVREVSRETVEARRCARASRASDCRERVRPRLPAGRLPRWPR